eukprot:4650374-Pyramimonas_sp.AAC.1
MEVDIDDKFLDGDSAMCAAHVDMAIKAAHAKDPSGVKHILSGAGIQSMATLKAKAEQREVERKAARTALPSTASAEQLQHVEAGSDDDDFDVQTAIVDREPWVQTRDPPSSFIPLSGSPISAWC